jgi:ATP phosphoribosyltransferase
LAGYSAIADVGAGVYLTVTGSTAREHGLVVGEQLFPSETVLLQNEAEASEESRRVVESLFPAPEATV